MKLFLIKFGKAFTTVRRDGLIVGGRRVLNYFGIFLKTISSFPSGDILFITGGVGDSAHYRAYNQAEELNLNGFKAHVMLQDNPLLPLFAGRFKIFFFQRTLLTPSIAKLIKNIKEKKREAIFETDDLVFDAKYIHATDLYKNKMGVFEKMQYAKGVGEEILKDPYVKVCTTSTRYLKNILENYGKKVFIVCNKISKRELAIANDILKSNKKRYGAVVNIGYLSGTMSHNKDFATITESLMFVLEKYPQVHLVLAGPLDIEDKLNKFKDRIVLLPLVPRDQYYYNAYKLDINLAPLEIGDPYCESKSELKFFETGILKIPSVVAATQTFIEAIDDGVDGFVAKDTEEWIDKLEKLIIDGELRKRMGERAREKALAKYTTINADNREYYDYLKLKVKGSDNKK